MGRRRVGAPKLAVSRHACNVSGRRSQRPICRPVANARLVYEIGPKDEHLGFRRATALMGPAEILAPPPFQRRDIFTNGAALEPVISLTQPDEYLAPKYVGVGV